MSFKKISKIAAAVIAATFVFGSTSFVDAKSPNEDKYKTESKKSEKDKPSTRQAEDKKSDSLKKEENTKKPVTKKQVEAEKAKAAIEKSLANSKATINKISVAANAYFGVTTADTTTVTSGDTTTVSSSDTTTVTPVPVSPSISVKQAYGKYNSYKGKLKAEINKLNALAKRIAQYDRKNVISDAEAAAYNKQVTELKKLANAEIQRIKELAAKIQKPTTTTTTDSSTVEVNS